LRHALKNHFFGSVAIRLGPNCRDPAGNSANKLPPFAKKRLEGFFGLMFRYGYKGNQLHGAFSSVMVGMRSARELHENLPTKSWMRPQTFLQVNQETI
jgi:hypothetical protein